jgi:glutathione S-transferase
MWYSNATSRVLATMYEKEVGFELIPIDIMKGEQKKPEFLAM